MLLMNMHMCVCMYTQRERKRQKDKQIDYEKLAHTIAEPEKSHNLPLQAEDPGEPRV